jgi:hypothetical protein
MDFKQYMHVERFGNDEVTDIELGQCWIFSKIDGTNASVWVGDDKIICAGSRKRELSAESDNHNFYKTITQDPRIIAFLEQYPDLRLFGEWLVPHTVKTYRDDAWRKFYVFDVMALWPNEGSIPYPRYMPYNVYQPLLEEFGLDYLAPIAKIKNPTYEKLVSLLDKTTCLVQDGTGPGEGIVIKNYDYYNRYDRMTWAKIVRSEFKEDFHKAMGPTEIKEKGIIEETIALEFVTQAMVDKVHANIVSEQDGWRSQYIPRLLSTVFHDLVTEEMWSIIKKFKNPSIHFGMLSKFTTMRIKLLKPELF